MQNQLINSIVWLAIAALGSAVIISLLRRRSTSSKTPLGSHKVLRKPEQSYTLQLREEQMDISKHWIQTDNVKMHRETIDDEQTIVVPVTREELVIEKSGHPQIIRIPLTEERVEVVKHQVVLNDVDVYTRHFTDQTRVDAILKKEQLQVHVAKNSDLNGKK